LGAIKGAAQLLVEDPRNQISSSDREFLSIILEEVDRLDRVVGSVLSYARPARGTLGEIDVAKVVERTARMLQTENPDCELSVSTDGNLPKVRGDAEQLRQVLINLIRNAVQAMEGGGRVQIDARFALTARSSHHGESADSWIEVCVQDGGPGIDPEVRENLFVPFITTKQRGSGLGLAISQRIVEEMAGRIEVHSQEGEGTRFSVLLPANSADNPAEVAPLGAALAPTGGTAPGAGLQ
jgi:signal transduction histidine kinase